MSRLVIILAAALALTACASPRTTIPGCVGTIAAYAICDDTP